MLIATIIKAASYSIGGGGGSGSGSGGASGREFILLLFSDIEKCE